MSNSRRLLVTALAFTVTAGAADSSLLNLVMPDAKVLAGVNVSKILASPMGKELRAKLGEASPELEKLLKDSGFDPTRDLQEILVAATDPSSNGPALFLARGNFNSEKFAALAPSSGGAPATYEGVEILSNPAKNSGALAFLDSHILIGGDPDQVRAAIRRRSHGTTLNSVLATNVDALSDHYDIWIISATPVTSLPSHISSPSLKPAEDLIKSIQQFSGGIKFSSNLEAAVELVTRTEKDATSIADLLHFFTGFLTADQKNPDALKPENIKLTVDARTVRVELIITEAQLKKAYEVQMARNVMRPAVAPPAIEKPRPAPETGLVIQSSDRDMGTVIVPPAKKD